MQETPLSVPGQGGVITPDQAWVPQVTGSCRGLLCRFCGVVGHRSISESGSRELEELVIFPGRHQTPSVCGGWLGGSSLAGSNGCPGQEREVLLPLAPAPPTPPTPTIIILSGPHT